MPISVDCSNCGKTLRAKDSAAGKTAKCPSCGELITIPQVDEVYEVYDAEDAGGDEAGTQLAGGDSYDSPALPDAGRCPCSVCGEMISEKAKKCRHCGEIFDEDLKRRSGRKSGSSRSRRGSGLPLASHGQRFLGALIDFMVILLLIGPGVGLAIAGGSPDMPGHNENLTIAGLLALSVGVLILFSLSIYMHVSRSQSLGKYFMNSQIIDYETDEPAEFLRSWLLRQFVNRIIGTVVGCCVPYVGGALYSLIDALLVFGEERRCVHDHLAGTYVADIS